MCGPNGCECKPIAAGGFIFEQDLVLHKVLDEIDPETGSEQLTRFSNTERLFGDLFEDGGDSFPIRDLRYANVS